MNGQVGIHNSDVFIPRHCSGRQAANGAFQKYAVVPSIAVSELPYSIPTSVGVVLPLGMSTAAAGLYQKGFLALPLPSEKPETLDRTVLIWGGSSSVGSCCIQLAVASGVEVITTASPRNFDYCKRLGAKQCFDYHDRGVEDQIVEALKGKTVAGAYHAVGADGAVQACARIVDRTKGKAIVVTVRGVPDTGIPSSVRAKSSRCSQSPVPEAMTLTSRVKSLRLKSSRTTWDRTFGGNSCPQRWKRVPLCRNRILWSWVRSYGQCSSG